MHITWHLWVYGVPGQNAGPETAWNSGKFSILFRRERERERERALDLCLCMLSFPAKNTLLLPLRYTGWASQAREVRCMGWWHTGQRKKEKGTSWRRVSLLHIYRARYTLSIVHQFNDYCYVEWDGTGRPAYWPYIKRLCVHIIIFPSIVSSI